MNADMPGFGVVAIATINAVGGGAFADVLLNRSPFILLDDFYASCAFLGGAVYWVVVGLGGAADIAATLCIFVTLETRMLAVAFSWKLPTTQNLGITRDNDAE